MPKFPPAALILSLTLATPAFAQNNTNPSHCRSDTLSDTDGQNIRLNSGQVYGTVGALNLNLTTWFPLDKLTICRLGGDAVEITDHDKHNASVEAVREYPNQP